MDHVIVMGDSLTSHQTSWGVMVTTKPTMLLVSEFTSLILPNVSPQQQDCLQWIGIVCFKDEPRTINIWSLMVHLLCPPTFSQLSRLRHIRWNETLIHDPCRVAFFWAHKALVPYPPFPKTITNGTGVDISRIVSTRPQREKKSWKKCLDHEFLLRLRQFYNCLFWQTQLQPWPWIGRGDQSPILSPSVSGHPISPCQYCHCLPSVLPHTPHDTAQLTQTSTQQSLDGRQYRGILKISRI